MNTTARLASFSTANPHALATILEASETKRIIASRDIFDASGIKLWARSQAVSQELQRKLLDRQLRQPLESCLRAEDGVTPHTLVKTLQAQLDQDTPLSTILLRHADKLLREAGQIPVHPVAQLLLTASQASRPESFKHAVQAMALNGALMIERGGSVHDLRLAMLCGLLHDLGEMYIAPEYGEMDADRTLDFQNYQQLVVHPHIGYLLLTQLTDYPPVMARAVAEHHERLDGSGYPHSLHGPQVSPHGRLLAVTDATLNVLRSQQPNLARASVALRVVPGEFDLQCVGLISKAALTQKTPPTRLSSSAIQTRLDGLDTLMKKTQDHASVLLTIAEAPALKEALNLAHHLLARLRVGWNASGLWSADAMDAQDAVELEAIEDELLFRLRAIHRAILLRAAKLSDTDTQRLSLLCEHLAIDEGA
ncbi:MAG: HD domain-containing protein [Burkholderiales bacterium]|nr:HD domain-containing protein [Burkholderiales bacterium]